MKNDVIAVENQNLKDIGEAPRSSAFSHKNIYPNQDNDYATFNIESSVLLNENTSQFDLYKGFFFVFISCLFKTFFSLFCKILLEKNNTITSFHLLAYKVYIMLAITILLCIFILYTYYINSVNHKNEGNEHNNYNHNNSYNQSNINGHINNSNNYLSCSNISKNGIDVSTNFNSHMNSEKDMLNKDKGCEDKQNILNTGNSEADNKLLIKENENKDKLDKVNVQEDKKYNTNPVNKDKIEITNNNNKIFYSDPNMHCNNINLNFSNSFNNFNKESKTNYEANYYQIQNSPNFYSSGGRISYSSSNNNINLCASDNNLTAKRFIKSTNFGSIFYLEDSDKLVFDIKRGDLILVFLRSLFSVLSVSLAIFGLQKLSISNFFSVYYVYPALVIILSFGFLNEKVRQTDYICLISCFIGMIFIIRPEFFFAKTMGETNQSFYLVVISAAIFKSLEDIIIRNIGKDIHFLIIPFIYSIVGIILYPFILILAADHIGKVHLTIVDLLLLFLIALCSFAYQSFMALGIQNEKAGRASMINYLQIPLMFLIDLIIFRKAFVFYDIMGTFIIFGFNFGNSAWIVIKRNNDWKKYKHINS